MEQPAWAARFWSKVVASDDPTACWVWAGARNRQGYGFFKRRPRQYYAHRVSWELTNGPVPAGLLICHKCDNPPCCNPAHLFIGTAADNAADRDAKGRFRPSTGERNGTHKLTAADAAEIKRLIGTLPQAEIARRYGRAPQTINALALGRTWKHV